MIHGQTYPLWEASRECCHYHAISHVYGLIMLVI